MGLLTSTSILKEFPEGKLVWLADKPTLSPPHNGLTVLDGAQEGSPACFTLCINGCGTDQLQHRTPFGFGMDCVGWDVDGLTLIP